MTAALARALGDSGRCGKCGRSVERGPGTGSPWRDGTGSNICPNGGAHAVDPAGKKP